MNLTPHFRLEEMVPAGTLVPMDVLSNLKRLCETCLEPARVALGYPLRVTSGWRPPAKNAEVGGAKASDHLTGRAADVQGMLDGDMDPERVFELFDWLRDNAPVGQLILEDHRISRGPGKLWVHVAIPSPKHPGSGDPNRLLVSTEKGVYRRWEPLA